MDHSAELVNLLPAGYVERSKGRHYIRFWGAVTGLQAGVFLILGVYLHQTEQRTRTQLETALTRRTELESKIKEIEALTARETEAKKRLADLVERPPDLDICLWLADISTVAEPGLWLSTLTFQGCTRKGQAPAGGSKKAQATPNASRALGMFSLSGYATSNEVVASFMDHLAEMQGALSPVPRMTRKTEVSGREAIAFELDVPVRRLVTRARSLSRDVNELGQEPVFRPPDMRNMPVFPPELAGSGLPPALVNVPDMLRQMASSLRGVLASRAVPEEAPNP